MFIIFGSFILLVLRLRFLDCSLYPGALTLVVQFRVLWWNKKFAGGILSALVGKILNYPFGKILSSMSELKTCCQFIAASFLLMLEFIQ